MLEEGMVAFALLGAEWVLWLLIILSVGCIAIAVERWFYLQRHRSSPAALADAVNAYLNDGDVDRFKTGLATADGMEGRILAAALALGDANVEAAEKAMSGVATAEKLQMERGLSFLATVGSNAPFIGLLGTVLGIMKAFQDLALDTDEGSAAVMSGISEALVATAVGLLVAIPAVVLFNYFRGLVKARLARASSLADQVLARMTASVKHGG